MHWDLFEKLAGVMKIDFVLKDWSMCKFSSVLNLHVDKQLQI